MLKNLSMINILHFLFFVGISTAQSVTGDAGQVAVTSEGETTDAQWKEYFDSFKGEDREVLLKLVDSYKSVNDLLSKSTAEQKQMLNATVSEHFISEIPKSPSKSKSISIKGDSRDGRDYRPPPPVAWEK
jgi:hypothetical protein